MSWTAALDGHSDATAGGLYALTRVSHRMAAHALPPFLKINKHLLPRLARYHIWLSIGSFGLFPAWARSSKFAMRDDLVCHFVGPKIDSDIDAVGVGLSHIRRQDHPKTFSIEGDLNVKQVLDLLEVVGQTNSETVQVEILHLDLSPPEAIRNRTVYELPQTSSLLIDWPTLPSHHWHVLLEAISAPRLNGLTLKGDVPWNSLAPFLSRHPTITSLRIPTSPITRVPANFSALQMTRLNDLRGHLTKVASYLKLLSCSASLSIDAKLPENMPLIQIVHKIVTCLTNHRSDMQLWINIFSTDTNGPLTKSHPFPTRTVAKWRESNQLQHLTSLSLKVAGIQDSVLFVSSATSAVIFLFDCSLDSAQLHCKNLLSIFLQLRHVTLRRDGPAYSWEWARVTRASSEVTWGFKGSNGVV